jgi:hypothetical protein
MFADGAVLLATFFLISYLHQTSKEQVLVFPHQVSAIL